MPLTEFHIHKIRVFLQVILLISIGLVGNLHADEEYENLLVYSIPEPMVFDLVRPMGARQGELEINTLGVFPLRSKGRSRSVRDLPDGSVIRDSENERIDWAPEIEYAVFDNFAIEFELPFEDNNLVAYKFAYQWTFGTALEGSMIHGSQGIAEYNRFTEITELTLLYLNGLVLSPEWSLLSMYGIRGEAGGKVERGPLELILNATLFYILSENHALGFEVNIATTFEEGENSVLLMPQWEWEFDPHWAIQTGVGVQFSDERTLPLLASRLIWTY
jgi:hypothetical protein